MPWAKGLEVGVHGISSKSCGLFQSGCHVGGEWRINKTNAVLGLIIHLHLSKKLFVCLCYLIV